jgi:3-deoxy-manno-octulosonate cytidylyltransferase (CMP-KDO synthetase)
MHILSVIPARLASTRLPGKPLLDICSKPMIVRVWEKVVQADMGPVLIACGDQEIFDVVQGYGAEAILTDPSLPTGTDRGKAAIDLYDPAGKYDYVVNVQGDLPTVEPAFLRHILDPFQNPSVDISTLAVPMMPHELEDPGKVKVAISFSADSKMGRALYFGRAPVIRGSDFHHHHIGIYGFKREALNRFVNLPVNDLETQEALEQLRALAHGMHIGVKVVTDLSAPFGVDTPADLEAAIRTVEREIA